MGPEKKRILLLGRDPVFAWAAEKKLTSLGWQLEHVYTIGEARIRMNRFHYDAYLLDGLSEQEQRSLSAEESTPSQTFVLEDLEESPACTIIEEKGSRKTYHIAKESALQFILSALQTQP